MTSEEALVKLREIRDSLHRKKYLRALIGDSDDLEGLIEYLLDVCRNLDESEVDAKEVHDVLYRLLARIFSTAVRKYQTFSGSFNEKFLDLCAVKNRYFMLSSKDDGRSTG